MAQSLIKTIPRENICSCLIPRDFFFGCLQWDLSKVARVHQDLQVDDVWTEHILRGMITPPQLWWQFWRKKHTCSFRAVKRRCHVWFLLSIKGIISEKVTHLCAEKNNVRCKLNKKNSTAFFPKISPMMSSPPTHFPAPLHLEIPHMTQQDITSKSGVPVSSSFSQPLHHRFGWTWCLNKGQTKRKQ